MSKDNKGWSGGHVKRARRYWALKMAQASAAGRPVRCSFDGRDPLCPGPVTLADVWHVDHVIGRADGGKVHDPNNWWPAHAACNTRASAHRTNAMRKRKANTKGLWSWT